ncbi:hypothetical protein ABBQ38_010779 [Trebouxia sp. C0009 RCD-2024]
MASAMLLDSHAPLRYSTEVAVARTAAKLASNWCTRAQLQLQDLKREHLNTERLVATTALGCQALLALVLQQGLPNQQLQFTAARDFGLLRAPQSSSIANSILEEVNVLLSGEPGYWAASDAEFAELIWTGMSQGGPKQILYIMLNSH